MSNPPQVTIKPSRRNASQDSKNVSDIETDEHSTPGLSITNATLHVTPHVSIDRESMVAVTAYCLAEQRGFEPGHEVEDWLVAEVEVDQRLMGEGRAY